MRAVVCRRLLALVLLLSAAARCAPDWADVCPSACRCKWSSGKKTALCRDAGFTAPPAALSADTQVLDLSGNAVPYLAEDAFSSVGLINLQRIYVRGARVREVHRHAFRDLVILVEVDLSDNLITSLHPDTFTGNARLKVLCLSGNPLRELRGAQFPALAHLRSIELQRCELTQVARDAFSRVSGVETLDLRHNRLATLDAATLAAMPRLKTLALDGNPWHCDCLLRAFRGWLLAGNLHPVPPVCAEPLALAGRAWRDVSPELFACAPHVTLLIDAELRVAAGDNVTLACRVRGDPEPAVAWLHDGREIGGENDTFVVEAEEGLLEKWVNVSVYNASEVDAGDYSCVARNVRGSSSRGVALVLPRAAVVSTVTKADSGLLWLGVACGVGAGICAIIIASVCACCLCGRQRHRKGHRRKTKLQASVSFTDQEKKLLDLSTATTDRASAADSCETLGVPQPDVELLEQCSAEMQCEPPVRVTVESRGPIPSSVGGECSAPIAVFPPPPEFSTSVLPAGAFGNIFISVSVSQDPNVDAQGYPDLLDLPRGAKTPGPPPSGVVSVATGTDDVFCGFPSAECYATLPRRQYRGVDMQRRTVKPQYDNMGPRITADGSSTLSLHDDNQLAIAQDIIPPPPPPPMCSPLTGEYVSL